MRFELEILPAAVADIAEAARWYAEQREGLGDEFALEISRTIDSLAAQALLFRVRYSRQKVRWAYPGRFPYRICYYVDKQTVRVFAVLHASRHDRQWKKRISNSSAQL